MIELKKISSEDLLQELIDRKVFLDENYLFLNRYYYGSNSFKNKR